MAQGQSPRSFMASSMAQGQATGQSFLDGGSCPSFMSKLPRWLKARDSSMAQGQSFLDGSGPESSIVHGQSSMAKLARWLRARVQHVVSDTFRVWDRRFPRGPSSKINTSVVIFCIERVFRKKLGNTRLIALGIQQKAGAPVNRRRRPRGGAPGVTRRRGDNVIGAPGRRGPGRTSVQNATTISIMEEKKKWVKSSVEIDFNDIGRIIGPGGSTIRLLEKESGANFKVVSEQGVVRLEGWDNEVIDAKKLIGRKLGHAVIRNADEATWGAVTRDLEAIRREFNVDVEADRQAVRIVSRADDVCLATAAKEQIVALIADLGQRHVDTITVPSLKLQSINSDTTITHLRDTQGLKLEIRKDDDGTHVALQGLKGVVSRAVDIVNLIVAGDACRIGLPIAGDFLFTCSEKKRDDCFEDFIQHINTPFDVIVSVSRGDTAIVISGNNLENAILAKHEVQNILLYYFPENCARIELRPASVEYVCGNDDRFLLKMQSLEAVAEMNKTTSQLWICGDNRAFKRNVQNVTRSLHVWHSLNKEIDFPCSASIGFLVGTRGERIRRIQELHGVAVVTEGLVVRVKADSEEAASHGMASVKSVLQEFEERQGRRRSDFERRNSQRNSGKGRHAHEGYHVDYKRERARFESHGRDFVTESAEGPTMVESLQFKTQLTVDLRPPQQGAWAGRGRTKNREH